MSFDPGQRVHILGVAGAGMSGVARLLVQRGCDVSGSDTSRSPVLDDLADVGVTVVADDDLAASADAAVLLWSPAVSLEHPALAAARTRGARLVTRSELFGELSSLYEVIGVTGTHGKTTATSMLAHVYAAADVDASRLLGAEVRGLGPNGVAGTSPFLLLETDESYGTFAAVAPAALALLNVEADHLDHYGSLSALEAAFVDLVTRVRGPVVVWTDDPGARAVANSTPHPVVTVGSESAQWLVTDVILDRRGARFVLRGPVTLAVSLSVTGHHNVANAATVAVLALTLGLPPTAVATGLQRFRGAPRRFDYLGQWRDMAVYEDYAHLPGEIAATLRAAKDAGFTRVACVFQPHRVTRTLAVGEAFAPAFDEADTVIVTALYDAGEPNPTGVTGEYVAEFLRSRRADVVRYAPTVADVRRALEDVEADALFFVGAGDVAQVATTLEGLA